MSFQVLTLETPPPLNEPFPYSVVYGKAKLSELDEPDTISVVVGECQPPRRRISFPPGRLQQRWSSLSCLRVREGRGETSDPVIFSQDRDEDDDDE